MDGRARRVTMFTVIAAIAAAVLLSALPAGAAGGGRIDLTLYYDAPVLAQGGHGTQTLTVTNTGADATAPATLTAATPVFVTVDPAAGLPAGCTVLFADPDADPLVPQVIDCSVPALRHGQSKAFTLTMDADLAAPSGVSYGEAVVVPAAGSPDLEQNPSDNEGWPSVVVNGSPGSPGTGHPPLTGHTDDLYLTTDLPALAVGQPGVETLTIGNRGPQPTSGPARLVVSTPPFVRIDGGRPLPAGCGFLYDSGDAAVPQVLACTVPAGLAPQGETQVGIPLAAVSGAPVQTTYGIADVFPDRTAGSADIDPLPANNIVQSGAQVVG